jgi:ferredoxin
MAKKIVKVDCDKCIGCNTCPLINPDIFELDPETFKSRVKQQPKDASEAETSVGACPVGAISIEEE